MKAPVPALPGKLSKFSGKNNCINVTNIFLPLTAKTANDEGFLGMDTCGKLG